MSPGLYPGPGVYPGLGYYSGIYGNHRYRLFTLLLAPHVHVCIPETACLSRFCQFSP